VMSHNLALAGLMVSLVVSMLPASGNAADVSKLSITSSAISDGGPIPVQFTCSGADQSPPLSWGGVPQGTKSLVLLLEDPDAPSGTFVHWVVYDISPSLPGFKSGAAEGSAGANSIGKAGYMGPCPPPGNLHHYHFRVFALDTNLNLAPNPSAPAVRDAMNGHLLESAELVGIFGR
jgi:Raf kinase inhibitor-like YbhB/YbcL family protein